MFTAQATAGQAKPQPMVRPIRRSVGTGVDVDQARKTPREVPDDLLHLEDFNDAELLRALWVRYERKEIYTWVGPVLVSVNPYRDIGAFTEERAARYASNQPPQAPHLFATVRAALKEPGNRHALLITGESGAGKTEATRAVLSFLAMRHSPTDYIRDRLLRSTPVLEAFGNAHTRQNTNSSRFGKFIEVHLSKNLEVVGATLQPYMLEASRVAGDLPQGERTYHVFYLLRATLTALSTGMTPQGPFWTRLAHAPEWMDLVRVAGTSLATSARLENGHPADRCLEWFEALHEGLVKVGMRHGEVADCCRLVAAVSLLADLGAGDSVLAAAAGLLRIQEDELRTFLSKAETSVGAQRRERLHRTRSEREAATLRTSFAQELYAALFGWLTRLVAKGIAPPRQDLGDGRALGLLDLYGFEVFSSNGFEQFLINYCNERLQQFFNRQVFTNEAEEYTAEGLDGDGQWRMLVTACQLPALALLEGEHGTSVGAFGVINDRSRCGFEDTKQDGGSALAQAITTACGQHPAFRLSARDSSRVFGIAHFAGEVFYEAAQFQRKNASAHRPDIAAFLTRHGGAFLREVLAYEPELRHASPTRPKDSFGTEGAMATAMPSSAPSQRKLFGRTLISVFREELNELCTALESRQCRHVRCLRPNDDQAPMVFDDGAMLRQCRYSGLLEATRIRRQGYAHRRSLRSFATRFALLLGTRQARRCARNVQAQNAALACSYICQAAGAGGISAEDVTIGYTKVFLREKALHWFEEARTHVAVGLIIAQLKGHHTRQKLGRSRAAALRIQAWFRGHVARTWVRVLIEEIRVAEERARAEARAKELRAAEEAAALAAYEARIVSASGVLQGWWRRRAARLRSMVTAVRREQEQIRKRGQQSWLQADEEVVVLTSGPSAGTSPVVSPTLSNRGIPSPSITFVNECSAQRIEQSDHCNQSIRSARRAKCSVEAPSAEESSRKTWTRLNRQAKETKTKKHGSSVTRSNVGGRGAVPARTVSPCRSARRHAVSVNGRTVGGGSGRMPPSPRSIRCGYRQEIARVLAQHRQLRRRLPVELRDLPAELMEAAHALGHSSAPVPPEVYARINELLSMLKAALNDNDGATSYYAMPDIFVYSMPEAPVEVGTGSLRVLAHSGPSAPALLQRVPSHPTTVGIAFHAPPVTEAYHDNLTPQRGGSLRHSHSARAIVRTVQSPRPAGFRSPATALRSPPASARAVTPTHGFHTPVRGPAKVLATTVSAPVPVTPRQVYRVVDDGRPATPTAASATVPMWAWRPQATTATPSAQVTSASVKTVMPADSPMSCRMPSPVQTARDSVRIALSSLPTPSRGSRHKVRVRSPQPVPVVHATPSTVTVPSCPGTVTTSPALSPTASPVGTPGVPPPLRPSNSAAAFVFPLAHDKSRPYKQGVQREPTAILPAEAQGKATPVQCSAEPSVPTWQSMVMPSKTGRDAPSRSPSPVLSVR